jgi:hypothetical protein
VQENRLYDREDQVRGECGKTPLELSTENKKDNNGLQSGLRQVKNVFREG